MTDLAWAMDPADLGWTEFWMRIGFLGFLVLGLTLAAGLALKVLEGVADTAAWLFGKVRRNR